MVQSTDIVAFHQIIPGLFDDLAAKARQAPQDTDSFDVALQLEKIAHQEQFRALLMTCFCRIPAAHDQLLRAIHECSEATNTSKNNEIRCLVKDVCIHIRAEERKQNPVTKTT